ncbi:MAG: 2-phosphosulfolactate phosphatase [Bacillota bacterium]
MFVDLALTYQQIEPQDVENKTCIVIDTLRATSTIVTALHFGCIAKIPALSVEDALQLHKKHDDYILSGEYEGGHLKNFKMGNSPLEYTRGLLYGGLFAQ